MTPPRIFHIQPGTDGGTERFLVTLAGALAERGVAQGFAIRPGRSWAAEVARHGVVLEGRFLRRTPGGLWDAWRLGRAIRRWRPDAVLAWRAPAARLVPALPGVAKLVRLGDYPRHVRHFRHLDAVVCNNPSIARHVADLGWAGATPVISNFARPVVPRPVARAELDTPADAFVVCAAGRFSRQKGFDLALRAMLHLPGGVLLLVGDGEEAAALRALAADLGIAGRVRFAGWRAEPMEVIAAADAFVLPSRDEPLGNVLLEAWHCGTPSVATRTDGPAWYATDGADCLLVPVDDAAAMGAALARLAADPALRARLAEAARRTLAARFSQTAVVDAYLALIEGLKGGRG